jgi:hypothetical protein
MPGLTRRMRGRVIAGLVALFALAGGVVAVVASQGKPLPPLTRAHNPRWYRFAVAIAELITKHTKTGPGLYLRGWDGRPVPSSTPGMLLTDAGSIAVFADLATVAPPH